MCLFVYVLFSACLIVYACVWLFLFVCVVGVQVVVFVCAFVVGWLCCFDCVCDCLLVCLFGCLFV